MRKKRALFLIILIVVFLGGCQNGGTKKETKKNSKEFIEVSYMDSMLDAKITDAEIESLIKDNRGKFVRWTAQVEEIGDYGILKMQLEGLPFVSASFNRSIKNRKEFKEYKKGDIITVSGNLYEYRRSLFESSLPIWKLSDCTLENTTEEEKQLVVEYNKKIEGEMAKRKEEETVAKAKAEEEANKVISTDYKTFQQNYTKLTQVQRNDYFQNVNGHMVQWTGTVEEVSSEFIYVRCLNMYTYDYVAYFSSEYGEILKSINKGDKITIKGRISDELDGKAWQLNECSIVK